MGVNGDNYSNSEGFENHNKIMFKFKRCDILNDLKKSFMSLLLSPSRRNKTGYTLWAAGGFMCMRGD